LINLKEPMIGKKEITLSSTTQIQEFRGSSTFSNAFLFSNSLKNKKRNAEAFPLSDLTK